MSKQWFFIDFSDSIPSSPFFRRSSYSMSKLKFICKIFKSKWKTVKIVNQTWKWYILMLTYCIGKCIDALSFRLVSARINIINIEVNAMATVVRSGQLHLSLSTLSGSESALRAHICRQALACCIHISIQYIHKHQVWRRQHPYIAATRGSGFETVMIRAYKIDRYMVYLNIRLMLEKF